MPDFRISAMHCLPTRLPLGLRAPRGRRIISSSDIQCHKKTVNFVLIVKRLDQFKVFCYWFCKTHPAHHRLEKRRCHEYANHHAYVHDRSTNPPTYPYAQGEGKQNIQPPCEGHVLLLQRWQWRCCNEGHRSLSNSFRGSWHNDRRVLKLILNIAHKTLFLMMFDYF